MGRRARFWTHSDGIFPEESSRGENFVVDTVLDEFMRPKFPGEPEEVRRRLRAPYSETWMYVLIGETREVVTISEYVYQEKWGTVVKQLEELVRKAQLPMYQRDSDRMKSHILRAAKLILQTAQEGD
ncbi:hypothetical protein SscP1EGY_12 [Streptomyces phage SscP1EGY]|nr:hypothetical protein SscP1EGY_12 [Streptomyces phage SscP1EGY]